MQYTREKSKERVNTESKNKKAVKVSLIVPMYLCEEYVGELLDSLCGQDFRDIEIICVVDGSTDNTLKRAKEYAAGDPRVRVFSQDHMGAGAARNLGMSMARGEYLMFPDADDEYRSDYVSKLLNAVEETGADIGICQVKERDYLLNRSLLYCGYSCVLSPKNRAIPTKSISHFPHVISHTPHGKIIRSSLIRSNGLVFSQTKSTNDMLFLTTALICAKSVVLLDDHLAVYNKHRNVMSISTSRGKSPQDIIAVYRQLYSWLEDRALADELLPDYCLKWSGDLRSNAGLSESDSFISCAVNELINSEPWKSMSDKQLRQKSQLYTGIAAHTERTVSKKLKKRNLSPETKASMERTLSRARRGIYIYSEIIRILRDEYGKDMQGRDNYLTARLNQFRQLGFRCTIQIICSKILKRVS